MSEYLKAAYNYPDLCSLPKMQDEFIQHAKDMALLSDNKKIPLAAINKLSSGNEYTLIKDYADEPVFIVTYNSYFGHTILDAIPEIFFAYESNPDRKIIILCGEYMKMFGSKEAELAQSDYDSPKYSKGGGINTREVISSNISVFKGLINILDFFNVNYDLIDIKPKSYIIARECYFVKKHPDSFRPKHAALGAFVSRAKTVLQIKDIEPTKKVYLSRTMVDPQNPSYTIEDQWKIRVFNEHILEEFFSSIGFEIVYPENFNSFEEQIRFMADVKVLVAPTTSGLNNMLWMNIGQTVVEFLTPLPMKDYHDLHTHYQQVASFMGHTFLRIPVFNNDSAAIVENIKSNDHILSFFKES